MSGSGHDCVGMGRCRSGSGLLPVLRRCQSASGLPGGLSLRIEPRSASPYVSSTLVFHFAAQMTFASLSRS